MNPDNKWLLKVLNKEVPYALIGISLGFPVGLFGDEEMALALILIGGWSIGSIGILLDDIDDMREYLSAGAMFIVGSWLAILAVTSINSILSVVCLALIGLICIEFVLKRWGVRD